MANFKTVRLETVFHKPDLFYSNHFLPFIGTKDEAGGGRPDVARIAQSEVPALVDVDNQLSSLDLAMKGNRLSQGTGA